MEILGLSLFWWGLVLINLSWLVQIVYMLVRDRKLTSGFAFLQLAGIAMLLADMYLNRQVDTTFYLQLASGAGAIIALILVLAKKD